MKFLLSLCIALLLTALSSAQITITGANLPGPGETYTYRTLAPPFGNIDVSLKGPNRSWNYSTLQGDSLEVVSYVPSSQTPYAFYFFNRFGTLIADTQALGPGYEFTDVYLLFKRDAGAYVGEGLGLKFSQVPLAGFYSDKDTIYHLPLTYGKADTSTYRFFLGIPTLGSYSRTGTRMTIVDGWGTITTPAGTYSCLRVTSETDEMDSLVIQGNGLGFPIRQRTIQWLTNQDKVPVLEITQSFTLTQWTTTAVRYRDQTTGIASDPKPEFTLYPNPASESIRIGWTGQEAPDEIRVVDVMGRMVFQKMSPLNGLQISVTNWLKGIYFVSVVTGDHWTTKTMELSGN